MKKLNEKKNLPNIARCPLLHANANPQNMHATKMDIQMWTMVKKMISLIIGDNKEGGNPITRKKNDR